MKQQYPIQPTFDGYYPQDEISLVDLWKVLVSKRWIIAGCTIICAVIAVLYALSQPRVYKAEVSIMPPSEKNIQALNASNQISLTTGDVYQRFLTTASSSTLQKQVFNEQNLLGTLDIGSSNPDNAFLDFSQSFTIHAPDSKNSAYIHPTTFSIEGQEPTLISQYLNGVVSSANQATIQELIDIINKKIELRLEQIPNEIARIRDLKIKERQDEILRIEESDALKKREILDQITAARELAKQKRLAEIALLEESDRIERNRILEEIESLRANAELKREDRIKQLIEAADIANQLGIKTPSIAAANTTVYAQINLKETPLYMQGEDALRAEIKSLKARTSDDPFIPELRDLQNKLKLLEVNEHAEALKQRANDDPFIPELLDLNNQLKQIENNRKLEQLKARMNDDPFIPELRELEQEELKLKTFSLDETLLASAIVDQQAIPPVTPIKPRRSMIAILGLVLGMMLGVFAAFFIHFLEKVKEDDDSSDNSNKNESSLPRAIAS